MIIGGDAEDNRDGEIIYQDCYYGEEGPIQEVIYLPTPPKFPKMMDLGYLSRYGTAVVREPNNTEREFKADCVTMYYGSQDVDNTSTDLKSIGRLAAQCYWFYHDANDLSYKDRYASDELWQRLHRFYNQYA